MNFYMKMIRQCIFVFSPEFMQTQLHQIFNLWCLISTHFTCLFFRHSATCKSSVWMGIDWIFPEFNLLESRVYFPSTIGIILGKIYFQSPLKITYNTDIGNCFFICFFIVHFLCGKNFIEWKFNFHIYL